MRTKTAILALSLALIAGLAYVWLHRPASMPVVSIKLLRYYCTTNAAYHPGNWVCAEMQVTNEGGVSISYDPWAAEPSGWARAQTQTGTTNGQYLAPPWPPWISVLHAGSTATFSVLLPEGTTEWQCGFGVRMPSIRERVLFSKFEAKLPKPLRIMYERLVWSLLPRKRGPEIEVRSNTLKLSSSRSPHNSAHALDAAMMRDLKRLVMTSRQVQNETLNQRWT